MFLFYIMFLVSLFTSFQIGRFIDEGNSIALNVGVGILVYIVSGVWIAYVTEEYKPYFNFKYKFIDSFVIGTLFAYLGGLNFSQKNDIGIIVDFIICVIAFIIYILSIKRKGE